MTKCVTKPPFDRMKGYDFRIFPHLTPKAKHEPGQVPCSIYRKTGTNLYGKHPRLGEWGCFGAPKGKWTTLSLVIERTADLRFQVSMAMNGISCVDSKRENPPSSPVPPSPPARSFFRPSETRHDSILNCGSA
jgi:hypothetical protein